MGIHYHRVTGEEGTARDRNGLSDGLEIRQFRRTAGGACIHPCGWLEHARPSPPCALASPAGFEPAFRKAKPGHLDRLADGDLIERKVKEANPSTSVRESVAN